MKRLPLKFIGQVVCSNLTSNLEVVKHFVDFYKENIYYKGLMNQKIHIDVIKEINELQTLASTALSETTEIEATKLIPRFINFFNFFTPEYVTFQEVPSRDEFGNLIFVYGFFSENKIELMPISDFMEMIKHTVVSTPKDHLTDDLEIAFKWLYLEEQVQELMLPSIQKLMIIHLGRR